MVVTVSLNMSLTRAERPYPSAVAGLIVPAEILPYRGIVDFRILEFSSFMCPAINAPHVQFLDQLSRDLITDILIIILINTYSFEGSNICKTFLTQLSAISWAALLCALGEPTRNT